MTERDIKRSPVPSPIAICLEDLDAPSPGRRYLQCVALPGGRPGLALRPDGRSAWRSDGDIACEIWVSADGRLILFRPAGAAGATVHRAGRSVAAPVGKPVVIIDGDEVELGSRSFRVHVHGAASSDHPPRWLDPAPRAADRARNAAAAAALSLGLAAAAPGCGDCGEGGIEPPWRDIDVIDNPPKVAPPPPPDAGPLPPPADAGSTADAGPEDAAAAAAAPEPEEAAAKPAAAAPPEEPPGADRARKRGRRKPPIKVLDAPPYYEDF